MEIFKRSCLRLIKLSMTPLYSPNHHQPLSFHHTSLQIFRPNSSGTAGYSLPFRFSHPSTTQSPTKSRHCPVKYFFPQLGSRVQGILTHPMTYLELSHTSIKPLPIMRPRESRLSFSELSSQTRTWAIQMKTRVFSLKF